MRNSMLSVAIFSSLLTTSVLAATSTPLANEPGAAPAVRGTGHGNAVDPMTPEANAPNTNNPEPSSNKTPMA